MSYNIEKNLIRLTERNGAPRHEDDKLRAIVKGVVETALQQQDRAIVTEMRGLVLRMERGFERLAGNIEAFITGEQDVAVAHLVDQEVDDVPGIARFKAEATVIYKLSAKDIAAALAIAAPDVAYLLSQPHGLDWVRRKPELWCDELFRRTKRRLWHSDTLLLLRNVISDPKHTEREGLSVGCLRVLDRSAKKMEPFGSQVPF